MCRTARKTLSYKYFSIRFCWVTSPDPSKPLSPHCRREPCRKELTLCGSVFCIQGFQEVDTDTALRRPFCLCICIMQRSSCSQLSLRFQHGLRQWNSLCRTTQDLKLAEPLSGVEPFRLKVAEHHLNNYQMNACGDIWHPETTAPGLWCEAGLCSANAWTKDLKVTKIHKILWSA